MVANTSSRLVGTGGRLFAEPVITPDATSFQVDNTSGDYYKSPYYKIHQRQLQDVPTGPPAAPLTLEDVAGSSFVEPIQAAKKIVFHAVGDTGASTTVRIATEAGVTDALARDITDASTGLAPAFMFHLGDIIYNFGEAEYYYDQFYDPFRGYDRPIFAIPGNHDGAVQFGADPNQPLAKTLAGFLLNFCAGAPGESPNAGTLVRSTMTQPGVYFTLDAPFVSIIGLYTNVLEDFGVISSQGGKYTPPLDDAQLNWLESELTRLKQPRENFERAVILACHHPPASADEKHGGAVGHSADIDSACKAAGLWPDAVLSGHAHLYQRFTRVTAGREIPYLVAGSGGHNVTLPRGEVVGKAPLTWGEFTLVKDPSLKYGYLTATVDMTNANAETLTIVFTSPTDPSARDEVVVNLRTSQLVSSTASATSAARRYSKSRTTRKRSTAARPAKRATSKRKTTASRSGKRRSTSRASKVRATSKRATSKRSTSKRSPAKRTSAKRTAAKQTTAKQSNPKPSSKRTTTKKSSAKRRGAKRT